MAGNEFWHLGGGDMLKRRALAGLLPAAAVFLCVQTAGAASLGQILGRTGMTQEDVNIMVRAGATLYASGTPAVGADTIWSNPQTGAYGMAEIVEAEGNCVKIAYRFRTMRQPAVRTVTTGRCLVDRAWKLSE